MFFSVWDCISFLHFDYIPQEWSSELYIKQSWTISYPLLVFGLCDGTGAPRTNPGKREEIWLFIFIHKLFVKSLKVRFMMIFMVVIHYTNYTSFTCYGLWKETHTNTLSTCKTHTESTMTTPPGHQYYASSHWRMWPNALSLSRPTLSLKM